MTATGADFTMPRETEEGATFTPWTDGWAIGFHVTAPGKPDRFLFLNPSQTDDLGESNAFVYLDSVDPAELTRCPAEPVCYVTVWDAPDPLPPTAPTNEGRA